MVGGPGVASGRCHGPPDRDRESVIHRSEQVAAYSEKILDETVAGEKALNWPAD